jgi:hypothetical protein
MISSRLFNSLVASVVDLTEVLLFESVFIGVEDLQLA